VLRRASGAAQTAVAVALLTLLYVTVIPWIALARRLTGSPELGWRDRNDPDLASLRRLRRLF
jgi:hypothetical protein